MQIALVRVGIDSGCGGMQGPFFKDGSFEFIPIPDDFGGVGVDPRTYGNTWGRHRRKFIEYFPAGRWKKMDKIAMHYDPEFETFTYGDPTVPKSGLKNLEKGDLLVFYCGLQGWNFNSEPALYIIGYFEVRLAGIATNFTRDELKNHFAKNFHVRHKLVFEKQKLRLVLVKGGKDSRLLNKAILISSPGKDRNGKLLKVLSPKMQRVFGDFDGHISFQRSPTRWVKPKFISNAAEFVRSLR
jgi:hypothetical protein